MTSNAILISKPTVNFDSFLASASLATSRNLAEKTDQLRGIGDDEKFVSCLAALAEPNAPIGLHHELLNHVTYSAFIVCPIYDVLQVLSVASGMVFSVGEARGHHSAMVLTGTLVEGKIGAEQVGMLFAHPSGAKRAA